MDKLTNFFTKKISAKGLAIFRIGYTLNFLLEILKIFNYRQLYFDKLPYLNPHFPDTKLLFLFWIVVLFFIIIGFYTRVAAIVNYLFTLILISSIENYAYHMFYVYIGINFILMFLPISKSLSVDIWLKKLKYLDKGIIYIPSKVSKLNYLLPVFIGLGLVYFDSVIAYKIKSPMWLGGLGFWLPSSLAHVTITDFQWILNQELIIKFLSYLTMCFEFMFIFLFWNKKYRLSLLIIGVGLHFGIYIEYPIPYFGLGCIAIYILMVPVSFWGTIWDKIVLRKHSFKIFYDDTSLYANRLQLVITGLDFLKQIEFIRYSEVKNKKDLYVDSAIEKGRVFGVDENGENYTEKKLLKKITKISPFFFLVYLFDTILFRTYPLKINEDKLKKIKFTRVYGDSFVNNQKRNKLRNGVFVFFFFFVIISQMHVHYGFLGNNQKNYLTNQFLVKYFGLCRHPVFMDDHFKGYNYVYGLKYKNEFIPMLNEKGMPDKYLSGGTYVNWLWRVNKPYVKEGSYSLQKGIISYSSFFAHQNGINLSKRQDFDIVKRKIEVSFEWQKDLLKKNIESPWEKVGKLTWENKRTSFSWDSNRNK